MKKFFATSLFVATTLVGIASANASSAIDVSAWRYADACGNSALGTSAGEIGYVNVNADFCPSIFDSNFDVRTRERLADSPGFMPSEFEAHFGVWARIAVVISNL